MASIDPSRVSFHYLDVSFQFPQRTKLKFFLLERVLKEKRSVDSLSYIFCTDAYLLEMNRQFLDHDTLTDIITFPFSANGEPLHSDIYISVERVRENAKTFETSFRRELHRVIFHGLLHLFGYKDKTKPDAARMREMEELLLDQYFRST
ncbi:MAG: ybeY [Flaviaesturariibacter sp.]|nr:ybeY [Flaviaesturariibacter sp.]